MDHGILEYVILHIHMINIKSNVKYTYIWIKNVIYYNTYMIYPASYIFLWVTLLDDKRNFWIFITFWNFITFSQL